MYSTRHPYIVKESTRFNFYNTHTHERLASTNAEWVTQTNTNGSAGSLREGKLIYLFFLFYLLLLWLWAFGVAFTRSVRSPPCHRPFCSRYRGYDSAGIGVHGVPIKVRKKVGKARASDGDFRRSAAKSRGGFETLQLAQEA